MIDEGVEGVDGRDIVVGVDVIQRLQRRIELRVQAVLNAMLEIKAKYLAARSPPGASAERIFVLGVAQAQNSNT